MLLANFENEDKPEPKAMDIDAKEERPELKILEAESYLDKQPQDSKARNCASDATRLWTVLVDRCKSNMHHALSLPPRCYISSLVFRETEIG